MSLVVVYLASPRIAAWIKWTRVDCLCASVTLLKKFAPPLPVIVFHEDYADEDKARLRAILPDIKFEVVDFSTHKDHFISHRPTERVGSYGYCMMCRFFSGVLQNHPALSSYSHYLRLDDDSYIIDSISPDTIEKLQRYDYVYNSTFLDPHPSLWQYATKFMSDHGLPLLTGYNDHAPYDNFHASSLAMWHHPLVAEFVQKIDEYNGCLKRGWTDSAIHSILINLLGPAIGLTVTLAPDFSYRHNQQCIHLGPHTQYCYDGLNQHFSWGPPQLG